MTDEITIFTDEELEFLKENKIAGELGIKGFCMGCQYQDKLWMERIRKAIEELDGEIQQINNKISRTRHTQRVRDLLSKRIIPETKKEALKALLKEVKP